MKLFFKRAYFIVLVSPLVLVFSVVFAVEKVCYFMGNTALKLVDVLYDVQRAKKFECWVKWARIKAGLED